jgi:ArsR family transcriptional regulator
MQRLLAAGALQPYPLRRLLLQLTDKRCGSAVPEVTRRPRRLNADPAGADGRVERLRSIAIDEGDLKEEAEAFKALADPCRLKILRFLKEGELCVCEIMAGLDRPQSSTSHHLSILKEAGLIKERRDGKWSLYRLSDGAVIEMMNQVKLLRKGWPSGDTNAKK